VVSGYKDKLPRSVPQDSKFIKNFSRLFFENFLTEEPVQILNKNPTNKNKIKKFPKKSLLKFLINLSKNVFVIFGVFLIGRILIDG